MNKCLKISVIGLLCGSLAFSGCGKMQADEETVALIDPVSSVSNAETAEYRNIYIAKTYSTSVYPKTKEYKFEEASMFTGFGAYPGGTVNTGDILAYTDTGNIEDEIEGMEEKLVDLQKQLQEYTQDMEKKIKKIDEHLKECERLGGTYLLNFQRETLQKEGLLSDFQYQTQVYQLDYTYYQNLLREKIEKKNQYEIIATEPGEVVAIRNFSYGDRVDDETLVMAVGDLNQKELKCDYINKGTINKAVDVYAIFDGVRCEIEYQPMDSDEYTKLSKQGATIYSTFLLKEDSDTINVGDFGMIVVVTDKREQALSVSSSAIHRDAKGTFVYVLKDGVSVYTSVKTGLTDGQYTEIVSGISREDKVLVDDIKTFGKSTATISYGTFHNSFEGIGYMYYPDSTAVGNTSEYGTMYLQDMKVAQYQHVEKGDVICTVRVVPDSIALDRAQTELKRLNERMQDLKDDVDKEETADQREVREKAIAQKLEDIQKVQEKIAEIQKDASIKALYADKTGIVLSIENLEKESILSMNQMVVQIANEDTCYVIVEDKNQLLNYGNEVTITYSDLSGKECQTQGMVAKMNNAGVSQNLQMDWALVLLPKEVIGDMSVTVQGGDGWWNRSMFDVDATIREMQNVLIVPKKAVTDINGQTYVDVMDEDGNVITTGFIAGGYDSENYWVVEGLTEGMKVCLK